MHQRRTHQYGRARIVRYDRTLKVPVPQGEPRPPRSEVVVTTAMGRWSRHLDLCDHCNREFSASGVLCPAGAEAYFFRLEENPPRRDGK